MDFKENIRICSSCLLLESGEIFSSVFDCGGDIARAIFNLSGIAPVEISGIRCLICSSCRRDVEHAEFIRQKVTAGQKQLAEMNSMTEVMKIHEIRKEVVIKEPSFPYKLSKSTLRKVFKWKHQQEVLKKLGLDLDDIPMRSDDPSSMVSHEQSTMRSDEPIPVSLTEPSTHSSQVKPEPVSPARKHSSDVEFVSTEVEVKREKLAAIPVKKYAAKKGKQPQPSFVFKEINQINVPGIKQDMAKASKPLRFKNTTKRKQIRTSFECDSCKHCFGSFDLLNRHMETHNTSHNNFTARLGDEFMSDDVIIVPYKPVVINIEDDDDEEDIESLLQMLY